MKHLMARVVRHKLLGDYTIQITFSDGKICDIDFLEILEGPLFGPLKDPDLFNSVRLDSVAGTLVWPSGADFDPDTLYNWKSVSGELISSLHPIE